MTYVRTALHRGRGDRVRVSERVSVCVCVCERERERESKEGGRGNVERAYFWAHARIFTPHVLP